MRVTVAAAATAFTQVFLRKWIPYKGSVDQRSGTFLNFELFWNLVFVCWALVTFQLDTLGAVRRNAGERERGRGPLAGTLVLVWKVSCHFPPFQAELYRKEMSNKQAQSFKPFLQGGLFRHKSAVPYT